MTEKAGSIIPAERIQQCIYLVRRQFEVPNWHLKTRQRRSAVSANTLLREKIESLERKYDEQFQQVFEVLHLMLKEKEEEEEPKEAFGLRRAKKDCGSRPTDH